MKHIVALMLLVLAGMLAACTPQPATKAKPVIGTPVTHNPLERAGSSGASIDRSCRSNADCAVKNVGNCCGYYPACVNVKAAVNPQAVADACRKSGTASVCGFPEISGCECVRGQCEAQRARVQ